MDERISVLISSHKDAATPRLSFPAAIKCRQSRFTPSSIIRVMLQVWFFTTYKREKFKEYIFSYRYMVYIYWLRQCMNVLAAL